MESLSRFGRWPVYRFTAFAECLNGPMGPRASGPMRISVEKGTDKRLISELLRSAAEAHPDNEAIIMALFVKFMP